MKKILVDPLTDAVCARVYNQDRVKYNEIPRSTVEAIDRLVDMYVTLLETLPKRQVKTILKNTERLAKRDNV